MTKRGQRIFEFGERKFSEGLIENYLIPVANWLMGPPNQPYVLSQVSGSNWECALTIRFLLGLDEFAELTTEMRQDIRYKSVQTVRWMLTQVHDESNTGQASWDGVVWDTAICARVVLAAVTRFRSDFSESEYRNSLFRINECISWLIFESARWHRDVRYAAGPADLAQVLATLVEYGRRREREFAALTEQHAGSQPADVLSSLANMLLAEEEQAEYAADDGTIAVSYWADCFNSAEVLEGLSEFVEYGNAMPDLVEQCRAAIIRGLRYLETNQSNGLWGGVVDTCGTLYGYLYVTGKLPEVGQEDHLVFKAIRWMCDEKQSLADGSFLHTTYATVFYASALLEGVKSWSVSARPTMEAYDIALWSAPVRATAERSKRLDLEQQIRMLRGTYGHLQRRHDRLVRIVTASIVFLALWILGLGAVASTSVADLSLGIHDMQTFWAIAGVIAAVSVGLTGGIVAIQRR